MVQTKLSKTSRSHVAQSFLFINKGKDSRFLSQSEKGETTRILSHVRNKNQRASPDSTPWKQHIGVIDISEEDAERKSERIALSLTHRCNIQQRLGCVDPGCPEHATRPRSKQTYNNYQLTLEGQPSYNSLDPFHCTVGGVAVTTALHAYGKQLRSKHARLTFCAECLEPLSRLERRPSTRHDAARALRLRACVDDELVLYSSIAHGYASIAWPDGQIGAQHTQFWINKTMEVLRGRLGAGIVENCQGIVMCIFTLTLTSLWNSVPRLWLDEPYEFCADHFKACRIHIQAMLRVVEYTGGWQKFDPYLLEGMILADKYVAIYGLQPPLIPVMFDPGRGALDSVVRSVTMEAPVYDDLPFLPELDLEPELVSIVQDIDHLHDSTRRLWRTNRIITSADEHTLYRRFQVQHYKLLLLNTSDASSEIVRITALVVLCNMPQYAAGVVFTHIMLGHLRNKITEILSRGEKIAEKVWLWCLGVASTTKVVARDRSWFVRKLLERMVQDGVHVDAHSICRALKGYVKSPWIDSVELQSVIDGSEMPIEEIEETDM